MAGTDHGLDRHQKDMVRLMRLNAQRHRLHRVFADFCEMAAISLSNAVDLVQRDRREARYLEIVSQYTGQEVQRFAEMLALLVESLQAGFHDALGTLFMSFEFGDQWKGQFFTPYPVASLMARMNVGDLKAEIERDGFVTVSEPACGAGAMVIATAQAALDQGVNYQQAMHATAQDIDATAHMAYVQFSLLHIPAIVVHGNTLALTEWEHWVTPAHVVGLWDVKLRQLRRGRAADTLAEVTPQEPQPVASSDDAALVQARAAVIDQRIEQAGQMALF